MAESHTLPQSHNPCRLASPPGNTVSQSALERRDGGEFSLDLLWVVNTLLPGLVGTLLFRDVPAVNSGDLLTLPHFSQGIILHSKVLIGNSRDVGIFFTNFIWNNLLERGQTHSRERVTDPGQSHTRVRRKSCTVSPLSDCTGCC